MPLLVAVKPGAVAVSLGGDSVYAFDGEGRLLAVHTAGRTFQRALDGRVLEKLPSQTSLKGPWERRRRWLSETAAGGVLTAVYGEMRRHAADLEQALGRASPPPPAGWLEATLAWDGVRLAADGERFRSVYAPVGMLPPDQYRAVVLQAAFGCPWNRCTFCTLYRSQRFRVRTVEEFAEHIAGVRAFFGAALPSRRWLFLGEGDALSLPTARLVAFMQAAAGIFPVAPSGLGGRALQAWRAERDEGYVGFAGFLDAAAGARRPPREYADLRILGLRRAHVGLETGHAPLYEALNKPGDVAAAITAVARLHAAGIGAGVIVLVGAGGRALAAAHVRDTLDTLEAMRLGPDDLVYLSRLRVMPDSPYDRWARAERAVALAPDELLAQDRLLAEALRRPGGPHVASYDIEEFFY